MTFLLLFFYGVKRCGSLIGVIGYIMRILNRGVAPPNGATTFWGCPPPNGATTLYTPVGAGVCGISCYNSAVNIYSPRLRRALSPVKSDGCATPLFFGYALVMLWLCSGYALVTVRIFVVGCCRVGLRPLLVYRA
jgi:hypothetical protein